MCKFLVRSWRAGLLCWLYPSLLLGCASAGAGFTRTDSTFEQKRGTKRPELYLDQPPVRPYRPVGLIYVTMPVEAPVDEVQAALVEKGQSVGCELLLEPSLGQQRPSAMLFGPWTPSSARLVHGGGHGGGEPSSRIKAAPESSERRYEFLCGVYLLTPT